MNNQLEQKLTSIVSTVHKCCLLYYRKLIIIFVDVNSCHYFIITMDGNIVNYLRIVCNTLEDMIRNEELK